MRLLLIALMLTTACGFEKEDGDSSMEFDILRADGFTVFTEVVQPVFEAQCTSCHTVGGDGPLEIFSYTVMKRMLSDGDYDSEENYLVRKIRDSANAQHIGGNRCPDGVNSTPCQVVKQWWRSEFEAEAILFYEDKVKQVIQNNCTSCHSSSPVAQLDTYDEVYSYLSDPFPNSNGGGGSSTSNSLIDRAMGLDHPGGNICNSLFNEPCRQFSELWELIFSERFPDN